MKFDEAFEQVDGNINCCDNNAFDRWYELLEDLRKEYAPIILLTKNQYRELKYGHTLEEKIARIKRLTDNASDEEADSYINDDMIMRSYLHPETIKVVDNEQ